MSYKKKTWKEKLQDGKGYPKKLKLESNFPCKRALEKMGAKVGDSVVIAPALDVYELMKKVPRGKLLTLEEICRNLARKHKVKYCCTLTTGIFTMIAANAAEEMKSNVPYWRTIKIGGELNEKYPGGALKQKKLLEKEGHTFIKKGKKNIKYLVKDYGKKVIKVC
jgi:alkylated DNA nucleotide flippase Atl1